MAVGLELAIASLQSDMESLSANAIHNLKFGRTRLESGYRLKKNTGIRKAQIHGRRFKRGSGLRGDNQVVKDRNTGADE